MSEAFAEEDIRFLGSDEGTEGGFPLRAARPTVPRRRGDRKRPKATRRAYPAPSESALGWVLEEDTPPSGGPGVWGFARVRVNKQDVTDAEEWVTSGPLTSLEPVRVPQQGPRSTNRIGLLAVADGDSNRFVWTESKNEKAHIINHIWSACPRAIVSQPVELDWELEPGTRIRHTPDLLIESDAGTRDLIDVKRRKKWDWDFAVQALLTEQWCTARDIGYIVLDDLPTQRVVNQRNLFQAIEVTSRDADLAEEILVAFDEPHSFARVADEFGGFRKAAPPLRHLMWHRRLQFDIDKPIRASTWAVAGETDPRSETFTFGADSVRRDALLEKAGETDG